MPTPDFVVELRELVGHRPLWLATAAGLVLDDSGRLLLGRRADTGEWAAPGGIVEPGEQPADCAVREIFEETGVIAVPELLAAVTVSAPLAYANGDQVQYLELTFRCRAVGGNARVNDDESVEVGWFPLDALPEVDQFTAPLLTAPLLTAPLLAGSAGGNGRAAFRFSGLDVVLASSDTAGPPGCSVQA
jgi:8-oxo-dGTP pyrophosphatase MutT (NUDIX family)